MAAPSPRSRSMIVCRTCSAVTSACRRPRPVGPRRPPRRGPLRGLGPGSASCASATPGSTQGGGDGDGGRTGKNRSHGSPPRSIRDPCGHVRPVDGSEADGRAGRASPDASVPRESARTLRSGIESGRQSPKVTSARAVSKRTSPPPCSAGGRRHTYGAAVLVAILLLPAGTALLFVGAEAAIRGAGAFARAAGSPCSRRGAVVRRRPRGPGDGGRGGGPWPAGARRRRHLRDGRVPVQRGVRRGASWRGGGREPPAGARAVPAVGLVAAASRAGTAHSNGSRASCSSPCT